ncbi:MAG: hypothetical protein LC624_05045 [Halobacteriales archaeon]|nr:hypothetical protein [Halobacteriales archaeon]
MQPPSWAEKWGIEEPEHPPRSQEYYRELSTALLERSRELHQRKDAWADACLRDAQVCAGLAWHAQPAAYFRGRGTA